MKHGGSDVFYSERNNGEKLEMADASLLDARIRLHILRDVSLFSLSFHRMLLVFVPSF